MYSKHFPIFAYLTHTLALTLPPTISLLNSSVLQTAPSVSFPESLPTVHGNNITLGGWPEQLPWKLRISDDLFIEVIAYNRYVTPALATDVKEALDWIISEIEGEGDPDHNIHERVYRYDWVKLIVDPVELAFLKVFLAPISIAELAKVLRAIRGCMFVYNYGPREIGAEIYVEGKHEADMIIIFNAES